MKHLVLLLIVLLALTSRSPPCHAAKATWIDASSGTSQEDSFVIEESSQKGTGYVVIATVPQDTTEYIFPNPPAGATRYYRVKAVNKVGSSTYSNEAELIMPPAVIGPPGIPFVSCEVMGANDLAGLMLGLALNETTGSTARDLSDAKNHGTLMNGPTWQTGGKYSGALQLDGQNDYVSIPDAPSLRLSSQGSIMVWVRFNAVSRWSGLIAKGKVNDPKLHAYTFETNPQNQALCALGDGTKWQEVAMPINPVVGAWQHLACVWDATTLKVYRDGQLLTSNPRTVTPSTTNDAPVFVGQVGGNVDRINGRIDEVRIYNRALTASEIQAAKDTPLVP